MAVIAFPSQDAVFQPIGHFVRLGEKSYRKAAELHATGRLKARRFVVDASKIVYQRDIIKMLREAGAEVVLDPRTAELASKKYCAGYAKGAPWAPENQMEPLAPAAFTPGHFSDVYGQIARCAVKFEVDVVLAPTHFIGDPDFDGWFGIDRDGCVRLRAALDAAGGQSIAIDYPLIAKLSDLADETKRMEIMAGLTNLPFDNLWMRIATSGGVAGPITARNLVRTLAAWHNFGKPIIADYMGGLNAEALLSLNVISGIAHGLGERSSFKVDGWNKEPKKQDDEKQRGGGVRIEVSSFGRSFTQKEMTVLLSAHGAKSLLLPADKAALPSGVSEIGSDARTLSAHEAERRFEAISQTPTDKRPDVFAQSRMKEAVFDAGRAARLNPKPEVAAEHEVDIAMLQKRLKEAARQTGQLRSVYEDLAAEHLERGSVVRAINAPRQATSPSATGS